MQKSKQKILLVDDDPLLTKMYQSKLTQEGYLVSFAHNGIDGIALAKSEKPNLILLDVMMPKMDGIDTLKELKKDPVTKTIPVVMLTNLGDSEYHVEGAKLLGAEEYLMKSSTDLHTLHEVVTRILNS